MMPVFLQYDFLRNALLATVLVSIACGIVGTLVVIKRIVFISGGISHAAFGGIGLGYWLGVNPLITVIPFSLAVAVGIGELSRRLKVNDDTAIGVLWAVGMALGILFVQVSPGYAPELMSYLFGNILTVATQDLWVMLVLDAVILLTVLPLYREFTALSFDEEFATVIGVPTRLMGLLLLCLVALSVVVLIRVVGVILVIALLTIPAAIGRQFTHDLRTLMGLSTLLGILLMVTGLWLSYLLDLGSGATIILVMATALVLISCLKGSLRFRTSRAPEVDS